MPQKEPKLHIFAVSGKEDGDTVLIEAHRESQVRAHMLKAFTIAKLDTPMLAKYMAQGLEVEKAE